jgi:hypothetical protein
MRGRNEHVLGETWGIDFSEASFSTVLLIRKQCVIPLDRDSINEMESPLHLKASV